MRLFKWFHCTRCCILKHNRNVCNWHYWRLWEHAWDQEDIGAVQSLLGDTLLPCSRLNFVLVCHAETIVVLAVANWVSAWTVDGYCSRLRLSKRYWAIVALLSRVILKTTLCVKSDAVGGECLFLFILLFASVLPLFLYSKGGEGSWLFFSSFLFFKVS